MKNKLIKNITKLSLGIFLIFFLSSFVSAGIASPYWEDYPLEMNYGETRTINFNLQNMVGNKDLTIKVTIKEGSDIASLEKDTYTAKLGTSDTRIPVTITIPKDYKRSIQKVSLEFTTISSGEETGMVSLGTGYVNSFNVIISEKPISKDVLIGMIIALISITIILVLIILIILLKKRTK